MTFVILDFLNEKQRSLIQLQSYNHYPRKFYHIIPFFLFDKTPSVNFSHLIAPSGFLPSLFHITSHVTSERAMASLSLNWTSWNHGENQSNHVLMTQEHMNLKTFGCFRCDVLVFLKCCSCCWHFCFLLSLSLFSSFLWCHFNVFTALKEMLSPSPAQGEEISIGLRRS